MRRFFTLFIGLHFSIFALGQYKAIDAYVKTLEFENDIEIEQMAKIITAKSKNEKEKVRAIFSWIASNIKYDVDYLISGKIPDSSPQGVLKSKKAVCQGYSTLFKTLSNAIGIQAIFVNGYIKSYGLFDENKLDRINHSWNIVLINDKWYPIDVTWASGIVNDENIYTQQINEKYFLADPYFFVTEHLPADPIFQLLPCPIKPHEFLKRKSDVLKIARQKKECYSYRDTLNEYLNSDTVIRLISTVKRQISFNANNCQEPVYQLNKIGYYFTRDINTKSVDIKTKLENATHAYKYYSLAYDLLKNTRNNELKQLKRIVKINLESTRNFIENNKLTIQ